MVSRGGPDCSMVTTTCRLHRGWPPSQRTCASTWAGSPHTDPTLQKAGRRCRFDVTTRCESVRGERGPREGTADWWGAGRSPVSPHTDCVERYGAAVRRTWPDSSEPGMSFLRNEARSDRSTHWRDRLHRLPAD